MTGDEMDRAIEFLLRNQATLEERAAQTQAQFSGMQARLSEMQAQIGETQTQIGETQGQISELGRVVQMQATSQSELNQTLTRAMITLAESHTKTEAKVDRLANIVERLVERLGA